MSFSRSHRRLSSGSEKARRDRNEIVGLSGWLFADLLLAVAVVFLVASVKPVSSSSQDENISDDGPPTVVLSLVSELLVEELDSLPIWNEDIQKDPVIRIEAKFSERVTLGKEKDVLISTNRESNLIEGENTGWLVKLLEGSDNLIWLIDLVPTNLRTLGTIEIKIMAGAAIDSDGDKNLESETLKFFAKGKVEKRIDTKNSSQISIDLPSRECNGSNLAKNGDLLKEIVQNSSYIFGMAGEAEPEQGKVTLGSYIKETYGDGARIGFVLIYGPGDDNSIAREWQPCIFDAFNKLNFIDSNGSKVAYKLFKETNLSKGKLKIEMYFNSSSDTN